MVNGTVVTGPKVIYYNEILVETQTPFVLGDLNRMGAVVCKSTDRAGAGWHLTTGQVVTDASLERLTQDFKQIKNGDIPSLSRLSTNRENIHRTGEITNGLWYCGFATSNPEDRTVIGIYSPGGG